MQALAWAGWHRIVATTQNYRKIPIIMSTSFTNTLFSNTPFTPAEHSHIICSSATDNFVHYAMAGLQISSKVGVIWYGLHHVMNLQQVWWIWQRNLTTTLSRASTILEISKFYLHKIVDKINMHEWNFHKHKFSNSLD